MVTSPPDEDPEFGRRGWILVGGVVLSFGVIPLTIYVSPPTGVSFRFAYLLLPLFPAIGLGLLALWATMRP